MPERPRGARTGKSGRGLVGSVRAALQRRSAAAGYSSDVYDFDAMGRQAPHHLGVLSHYDAVVWETGNDIILRAPGQVGGTTSKAAVTM